jgi:hypothetical protein
MAESELLPRYHLLNLLRVLDPTPDPTPFTYASLALRCRNRLWDGPPSTDQLPTGQPPDDKPDKPGKPPPAGGISEEEEERAIREAVSFFAPVAGDHLAPMDVIVARLAQVLDHIRARWTSGVVQPIGPSGATVTVP